MLNTSQRRKASGYLQKQADYDMYNNLDAFQSAFQLFLALLAK